MNAGEALVLSVASGPSLVATISNSTDIGGGLYTATVALYTAGDYLVNVQIRNLDVKGVAHMVLCILRRHAESCVCRVVRQMIGCINILL